MPAREFRVKKVSQCGFRPGNRALLRDVRLADGRGGRLFAPRGNSGMALTRLKNSAQRRAARSARRCFLRAETAISPDFLGDSAWCVFLEFRECGLAFHNERSANLHKGMLDEKPIFSRGKAAKFLLCRSADSAKMMTMIPILETPLGQLHQTDCIRMMRALEPECVDLAFADPPFNLGKTYTSRIRRREGRPRISRLVPRLDRRNDPRAKARRLPLPLEPS